MASSRGLSFARCSVLCGSLSLRPSKGSRSGSRNRRKARGRSRRRGSGRNWSRNRSGSIKQKQNLRSSLNTLTLLECRCDYLVEQSDVDGDGSINYEEFVSYSIELTDIVCIIYRCKILYVLFAGVRYSEMEKAYKIAHAKL